MHKTFFGWAISRCLSTTPHPINRARGSVLLVHYSMIILKPAIFSALDFVRNILMHHLGI